MTTTTEGPKKGSSGLKLVLVGCCGCLGALVLLVGMILAIVHRATGPAVEVARGHLKGAAADPARAYAACASTFKASTTEAAFKAFVAAHPGLYQAADLTFSSRSYENGVVRLRGHATSAAGVETRLEVQLIEEAGAWRVTWVGSPEGAAEVVVEETEGSPAEPEPPG